MEEDSNNSDEEQVTMKPVYSFEWADGTTRRTDELENDGPHFREAGVELLAQLGREDPDCEVKMVGLEQIAG